jgi:hypothetical protein
MAGALQAALIGIPPGMTSQMGAKVLHGIETPSVPDDPDPMAELQGAFRELL